MSPAPPGIARALITWATEPAERRWLLGDLDEEFAIRVELNPGRARRWYWRQAVTSLLPLVRRRIRRRPQRLTPAKADMLDDIRADLRYALRAALRAPAPTATILLTVATGIAAVAAVSTVVWHVLLQPLPLREPDRVLSVYRVVAGTDRIIPSVAYPDLQDWRHRSQRLVGLAPYTGGEGTLTAERGSVPIDAVKVGEDYFTVLGTRLALGRAFERTDFAEGAADVVILSGATWQREFGGDSSIVGRSIELGTGRATVVGVVAPGEFTLPVGGADVWVPLRVPTTGPTAWMNSRGTQWLEAVARVRSDADVGAAMAELRTIDAAVQREFPRRSNVETVLGVSPLQDRLVGPVRTMLLFLAGAVVIVIAVMCTNVANMRLAQAHARQGELAMRAVLGAGAGRLRRHVVTESMALSVVGALLGLLLARPLLRGLLALYPGTLPRVSEIGLDAGVIGWSVVIAVVAGVLFAIPQMIHLARMDSGRVVREGERRTTTRGQRTARRAMVVVQLALSVVLLVSSGLLVRTYREVTRVSPGFDARGVLSFALAAPPSRYPNGKAAEQLYRSIEERLRALPGVQLVGETNALPLTVNPWRGSVPLPDAEAGATDLPVNIRAVNHAQLDLLRVPLRRGRRFTAEDENASAATVLINEALAARLYPGEDPVGKVLPLSGPRIVVGVVADLHHTSLTAAPDPEVYVPFAQLGTRQNRVLAIRSDGNLATLADAAQRAVHEVDPQLAIRSLQTLDDVVATATAPQRFRAAFVASLAVLAFVLAVVGVYGIMSFLVSERTRELGIRVALGDSPAGIRRRVIGEGLQLAALGGAIGGAAAWAVTRALDSMMFGVGRYDPWTLGAVALLLTLATIIAADGPARRAGRIDPVAAMGRD